LGIHGICDRPETTRDEARPFGGGSDRPPARRRYGRVLLSSQGSAPHSEFEIDGEELSVHELQPGTTLTATVSKTETTVAARTKKSVNGRVWFVAPPTVILTMENGENQQFTVRAEDDVKFAVNGKPATVFDLRKDMDVSAEKIVEEPRAVTAKK
jgi:hypothetical protein